MKKFRKLLILISILIIITIHSLQLSTDYTRNVQTISDKITLFKHYDYGKYFQSTGKVHSELWNLIHSHNISTSLVYKQIVDEGQTEISVLSIEDKCRTYFDNLYKLDENWNISAIENSREGYNRDFLILDDYIQLKTKEYKDQLVEKEKERIANKAGESSEAEEKESMRIISQSVPNKVFKQFYKDFEESLKRNEQIEQKIVDGLTHLRIFGKCFLENEVDLSKAKGEQLGTFGKRNGERLCQDVESRLFPWLTGKAPRFERWNNDSFDDFPKVNEITQKDPDDNFGNYIISSNQFGYQFNDSEIILPTSQQKEKHKQLKESEKTLQPDNEEESELDTKVEKCFVESLKTKFKGKGIVMTASDAYVSEAQNLIKILRGLDNKLPIQIIHKGDLSKASRQKILNSARGKTELPYSFHKISKILPTNFSKQEVWFVNVKRSITPEYSRYFSRYANKLLATFFNSFEEMILMDLDVIPFIDPIEFFRSPQYSKSGTFFFKDREIYEKQKLGDSKFFKKLFPTKADQMLFDIPEITSKTLDNRYIKYNYVHYMEAGIVVLNKKQHLTGVITTMQLQLYEPSSVRVWGDKELFWMGMAVAGDENFEFNKDSAYAIGEKSQEKYRFSKASKLNEEVCSSHPGHVSEDGRLLWMNSGFKNCKNLDTYEMDSLSYKWSKFFNIKKGKTELQKKLKYYYNLPTRINYAILPTVDVKRYYKGLTKENDPNLERTWKKRAECLGYLWCAYISKDEERITNEGLPEEFHGKAVEFDENTKLISEFLGDLWISNYVDGYKLPDEIEVEAPGEAELEKLVKEEND